MSQTIEIPQLLNLAAELYRLRHDQPLPVLYPDRCWEFEAGEFAFAFNGHPVSRDAKAAAGQVPPFSLSVYRDGWPVAICNPAGGNCLTTWDDEPGATERAIANALQHSITEERTAKP